MKKILIILSFVAAFINAKSQQTYKPSRHAGPQNKPSGISSATPLDSRSYFYDSTTFTYRPYASRAEILSYLNLAAYRSGQFPIIMDSSGVRYELWFRNGTTNSDLVLKYPQTLTVDSSVYATKYYVDTAKTAIRSDITTKLDKTLASGKIFVGNGSNIATAVTPSGDVNTTVGGSFTIQPNVISYSKIQTNPAGTLIGNPSVSTANNKAVYGKYGLLFDADSLKVDTATLKSIFASTSTGVDTIYRTPGVDSIYYTKNGFTYAIKDSTGGGGGSGTVTNISTGFGLLGGPITTTGTLKADSSLTGVATNYALTDSVLTIRNQSNFAQDILLARGGSPIETFDGATIVKLPDGRKYIVSIGGSSLDLTSSSLYSMYYDGKRVTNPVNLFPSGLGIETFIVGPNLYVSPNGDSLGCVFIAGTGPTDIRIYKMFSPINTISWSTPAVIGSTHTAYVQMAYDRIIRASDGNYYCPYDSSTNGQTNSALIYAVGKLLKTSGNWKNWDYTSVNISMPDNDGNSACIEPGIIEINQVMTDPFGSDKKIIYYARNRNGYVTGVTTTNFGSSFTSPYNIYEAPNTTPTMKVAGRFVFLSCNSLVTTPLTANDVRKIIHLYKSADGGQTFTSIFTSGTLQDTVGRFEPSVFFDSTNLYIVNSTLDQVSQHQSLIMNVLDHNMWNGTNNAIQQSMASLNITGGANLYTPGPNPAWHMLNIFDPTLGFSNAHISFGSLISGTSTVNEFRPGIESISTTSLPTGLRFRSQVGQDAGGVSYSGAFNFNAFTHVGGSLTSNEILKWANNDADYGRVNYNGQMELYGTNPTSLILKNTQGGSSYVALQFKGNDSYEWDFRHYGTTVSPYGGRMMIINQDSKAFQFTRTGNFMIGDISNADNSYTLQVFQGPFNQGIYTNGSSHFADSVIIDDKLGIGTLTPDSLTHINGGLHVAGGIRVDNIAAGIGVKAVRYDPSNGQFTYADTLSGSSLSMGTINSQTKAANGAVITGGTLVMQTADASNVGLMTASQWNTVDSVQKNLYPRDTLYYNRYTVGTGLSPAFLRNDTFNVKDLLFTNGLTPVQNSDSTITIKDGGTLTENTTKTLSTLNYTFSQNSTGRLKLSGLKQDPYLTVLGHAADSSVVQLTAASLLSTLGIATGTYTPTLTNGTNVAASTAHLCYWYQIGDNVTVYGVVEIDPSAVGALELGMSLPFANDFTDAFQVGGGADSGDFAEQLGVYSDATNNRISLRGIASSSTNTVYSFQLSYIIVHI